MSVGLFQQGKEKIFTDSVVLISAILQRTGLVVDLISIEIGCLGHFMPETLAQVATACCVPKKTVRSLFEQAARIAIPCSYRIFNSRVSLEWDLSDLLT